VRGKSGRSAVAYIASRWPALLLAVPRGLRPSTSSIATTAQVAQRQVVHMRKSLQARRTRTRSALLPYSGHFWEISW